MKYSLSEKVKRALLCICVMLCMSLVFFVFSFAASDEYEGDKYLPEIIIEMAEGSRQTLGEINDFDRYERAYALMNSSVGGDYVIEFQSSGADGTHQFIAANALRIMANDLGNSTMMNYSSTIVEYADWPDSHDIGALFNTHFYNPYTEKNYGGSTESTAKNKAISYYNDALDYYKKGNLTSAMQELGKGAHFVADACEAHHATNKTALGTNHSSYEKYIDTVLSQIKVPGNTLDSSVYEEAKICTPGQILRNNSYASYCLGDRVTVSSSSKDYFDAANATVINAIIGTVQYYYSFAVETGLY